MYHFFWDTRYEVIEDILPFVLNTKWPLSNIWLLRYKQNTHAIGVMHAQDFSRVHAPCTRGYAQMCTKFFWYFIIILRS